MKKKTLNELVVDTNKRLKEGNIPLELTIYHPSLNIYNITNDIFTLMSGSLSECESYLHGINKILYYLPKEYSEENYMLELNRGK